VSIDNGGPAFPGSYTGNYGMPVWSDGMTLRDYFAAKAMQGFITGGYDLYPDERAKKAYDEADAMIVERNKRDNAGVCSPRQVQTGGGQ